MKNQNRSVVPRGDRGWANKMHGARKATSVHRTQEEAARAARRELEKSGGGELLIHGIDGRIRRKNTIHPAEDPFPPRG